MALRQVVLRAHRLASVTRGGCKYPCMSQPVAYFSQSSDDDDRNNQTAERAEQARGAMREYFASKGELGTTPGSLWAKLKQDFRDKIPPATSAAGAEAVNSAAAQRTRNSRYDDSGPVRSLQTLRNRRQADAYAAEDAEEDAEEDGDEDSDDENDEDTDNDEEDDDSDAESDDSGDDDYGTDDEKEEGEEEVGYGGDGDRNRNRKGGRGGKRAGGEGDMDDSELDSLIDPYFGFDPSRQTLNYEGLDPMDALLQEAFEDTGRRPKGSTMTYHIKNVHMQPRRHEPRDIRILAATTIPDIRGVPVGSPAYDLGVLCWTKLSRNRYYTEEQKYYVANKVARITDHIFTNSPKNFTDWEIKDNIYHPDFVRGVKGRLRKKLSEDAKSPEYLAKKAAKVKREAEELKAHRAEVIAANWDVVAVEDADELDRLEALERKKR